MSTNPQLLNPDSISLADLSSEPGRQSKTVDLLGENPAPFLYKLKSLQMAIPPSAKELIIAFDDEGNIYDIRFIVD